MICARPESVACPQSETFILSDMLISILGTSSSFPPPKKMHIKDYVIILVKDTKPTMVFSDVKKLNIYNSEVEMFLFTVCDLKKHVEHIPNFCFCDLRNIPFEVVCVLCLNVNLSA